MIKKGTLVQIKRIILDSNHRSTHIPLDTQKTDFIMWLKGVLLEDADMGQLCQIETKTHRIESGILIATEPHYTHSFGKYVKILDQIADQIDFDTENSL